jgi:DNA-binding MurR/RpiR family transcriptional regulator
MTACTEGEGAHPASARDGVLDRIRYRPVGYKRIEGRIASCILGDPNRFVRESIISFSSRAEVSTGSVSRFARLLGFAGFRELKLAVAADLPAPSSNRAKGAEPGTLAAYVDEQVRALLFIGAEVDELQFRRAADAIAQARGIDLVAIGSSASIAHAMLFSFTLMGFRARFLPDSAEQPAAAAFNTPDDALIAVSFSGRTRAVVDAAERAAEAGATVIALTCNARSPLMRHAHIALVADVREIGSSGREWPYRTALLALSRALTLEVGERLPPRERRQRQQKWTSGRFGIRYEDA